LNPGNHAKYITKPATNKGEEMERKYTIEHIIRHEQPYSVELKLNAKGTTEVTVKGHGDDFIATRVMAIYDNLCLAYRQDVKPEGK
jgi:hypothetical protein